MTSKLKLTAIAITAILTVGFTYYVFTAPYTRFPGVRLGGSLTAAPADWRTLETAPVADMKLAGFPPFVIHIWYIPDENGIITATRPDNGYWARRLRTNPDGLIRVGDKTYELTAREITGEARLPYLEAYGAKYSMPMRYDFADEIIAGVNEPLHTWEVFYWTAR